MVVGSQLVSETLALAECFLRAEVEPNAQLIDQDVAALKIALTGLQSRRLMALRIPKEYGAPHLEESEFRSFQELVARKSGVLAFLQTQHQSAVAMLSKSDNEGLKERILPFVADGTISIGIGISQLRRAGPPTILAEKAEGGYLVGGHIPWITGFGLFNHVLVAASLKGGQSVFFLVPFSNQKGLNYSLPMALAAMQTAQTVTAELTDWFVPASEVVYVKPPGWVEKNDQINIVLQGHFALGCAMAGLDVLEDVFKRKPNMAIRRACEVLGDRVETCRARMFLIQLQPDKTSIQERLSARAEAIELAAKCSHAAVVASSGAANSLSHPAQRIYREALVFTVSAQTSEILEATLDRLIQ